MLRRARRTITILRTRKDLDGWRAQQSEVGLVPTMGALHAGHADLMRRAAAENDIAIASIFVNPTQFAPGEDLEKYPRTFERDVEVLRDAGVAACFAPTVEDMYGDGDGVAVLPPPRFDALSEGAARPGHFSGVCTVVAKLWNAVRPKRSYFGQKDAMQCAVLRSLRRDLAFDLEVVVCDTARADDGLALSRGPGPPPRSERRRGDARGRAARSPRTPVADYDDGRARRRPPPDGGAEPRAILSVAVRLGNVRLIDNLPLRGN
ncbi:pantoate-beta-alanine ligase [Aureococcus anophagefferens]|nr:pantoate-beta-alanine ligase [Aureococcus anophagefferens]